MHYQVDIICMVPLRKLRGELACSPSTRGLAHEPSHYILGNTSMCNTQFVIHLPMCNTQFGIHLHYNLDQTLKTPPAPNALSDATPTAWKKSLTEDATIMFPRKFPSFCTECKPHPKSGLGLVSLLATVLPMTHNTGPKFISNWSTLTGEVFLCGSFHMVQTLHFHSPYPPP